MQVLHRKIIVNRTRCTGCQLCELDCSFLHGNAFQPAVSRIRIQAAGEGQSPLPFLCLHCSSQECTFVCPTNARLKDPETGQVTFKQDRCIACKMCILSCPHGGPVYLSNEERVVSCDLCRDETPACVEACTQGALSLRDIQPIWDSLADKEKLLSPGLGPCQGCAAEWAMRFSIQILGRNTVLGIPPCCMGSTGIAGFGLNTGAKIPIVYALLGNAAAQMVGIKHHFIRRGKDVHSVVLAGDGATADIGFQALSAAAERGENIIYICYDNEAYMNTGIQRSGTTPLSSWTTTTPVGETRRGKNRPAKNVPVIMLMHNISYVATACPAFPLDFLSKMEKATKIKDGLVYIHILTPCPPGWRFSSQKTMEIGRLAVETNFFPLWEAEYGKLRFTNHVRFPRPVEAYTKMIGKYDHLTRQEISALQETVDSQYQRLLSLSGIQYKRRV